MCCNACRFHLMPEFQFSVKESISMGNFVSHLPLHGYYFSQEGDLISLGPFPRSRPGMVGRKSPSMAMALTLWFSLEQFGVLASWTHSVSPMLLTAGSSPQPPSIELAHDQFQNETFDCQIYTAVICLLSVRCVTCHLLAPFLEKKRGQRSSLRTTSRQQFRPLLHLFAAFCRTL